MDREDLTDRLPTDRIPLGRVPGLGGESEPEPTDTFDGATADPDTAEKREEARDDTVADSEEVPADEEGPSRREQARKALLGVSIGGSVLAVVAAVLRRLLGGDGSEGASEADGAVLIEPVEEGSEPPPDAEAVAAVIGLAFQLLVRRLVGEDDPDT